MLGDLLRVTQRARGSPKTSIQVFLPQIQPLSLKG